MKAKWKTALVTIAVASAMGVGAYFGYGWWRTNFVPLVGLERIQQTLDEGDKEQAIRYANKRLSVDPNEIPSLYLLAAALVQNREFEEALEKLNQAERLIGLSQAPEEKKQPVLAQVWALQAEIYREYLKDYKKAAVVLEKQVAAEPEDWETHYELGTTYAYLGLSQSAFKEFQLIAEKNPGTELAKEAENAIQYVRERRNPGKSRYLIA